MNYDATMQAAAKKAGLTFDDTAGPLQLAHIKLLAAAVRGEIDLNHLAKMELANRGMDANGNWVGFAKAAEIHGLA